MGTVLVLYILLFVYPGNLSANWQTAPLTVQLFLCLLKNLNMTSLYAKENLGKNAELRSSNGTRE